MKKAETIILEREDLSDLYSKAFLEDIELSHFKNISLMEIQMAEFVFFLDGSELRILKNRYIIKK
nr:hypothetical protein [uncultured Flavobacterium sp.]